MKELIDGIINFRDERNWAQFHSIKDLLLGLNIEVGELQELFLWNDIPDNKKDIANEIADIFIFLVYISEKLDIDIEKSVQEKLKIHADNYPVESSRNKTIKYTNLKSK